MILNAYKLDISKVKINQMPLQREWMDDTFDKHAYHCHPMSMANRLGWSISFTEDVSFIWDGVTSPEAKHVRILSGSDFASSRRGTRTVSFDTQLFISPEKNVSILTMPPPNMFFEDYQCVSTIISTSANVGDFPVAIMVKSPNKVINIKAGTPVASIFPISITELNNTELFVKNELPHFMTSEESVQRIRERGAATDKMNAVGEWSDFYRNAIDHNGEKLGEHEAKRIIMKVHNEN